MTTKKPAIVLSIKDLKIHRSRTFTLEVPSLNIPAGHVTCVAGANGSGKTTLIEAIVGLLTPGHGHITVAGQSIFSRDIAAKRLIGFVPDDDNWIVPELTAREFFDLLIAVYGSSDAPADRAHMRTRVRQLADQLLFAESNQPLGSLSHGNRKKVQIIAALLHSPALLVVDELRNGLDPIVIKRAEQLLQDTAAAGTAVLASTHDLWWAERFADSLLMIHSGRVLLNEPTKAIVAESGSVEHKFMQLMGNQA